MMGFDLKYLLLILSANLLPTLSSRFFWSKSDTHGMSVIMRCKNNKKPSIYVNRSLSTNLEKKKKKGSIYVHILPNFQMKMENLSQ